MFSSDHKKSVFWRENDIFVYLSEKLEKDFFFF